MTMNNQENKISLIGKNRIEKWKKMTKKEMTMEELFEERLEEKQFMIKQKNNRKNACS